MLLPLAFAAIIICLSIVCQSVSVCVCALHFRRKPCDNHTDSALTHMCTYVYVCVSYLPLAALFISLFMSILVFMVSLPQLSDCRFYIYVAVLARARSPASYGKSALCVRVCVCIYSLCMSMKFPALGPFALWSAYVPSLFY